MTKAVLFDLDGTLVNSLADLADACNEALEAFGYAIHPTQKYRDFIGTGAENLVRKAMELSAYPDREPDFGAVRTLFSGRYSENYLNKTYAYDGVLEMLAELKSAGIRLAVLSNKPHEFTIKLVEHLFPKSYFDAVLGKREGKPLKPSAESVFEMLDLLDIKPNQAIFVGDSAVDFQTSQNAGLRCVLVDWGFEDKADLASCSAELLAGSARDIVNFCLK